jgi:hypothetical protein
MEQFVIHTGRLTGQRALLLSWCIWLFCLIVMPVTPVFQGNFDSVALLVSANIATWLGLSSSTLWERYSEAERSGPRTQETRDINIMMFLLVIAGGVAVAARTIDYSVFRGISLSDGYEQIRKELQTAGPNVFSAVYGLGYPAAVAGGILAIPLLRAGGRRIVSWLAIVFYVAVPIFSFIVGGRSTLFMVVALATITLLLVAPQISTKFILTVTSTLVLTFIATMILFAARLVERGASFEELAKFSTYTLLVPLDDSALIALRDLSLLPRLIVFYTTSVGQYILHGVFEFFSLLELKSPDDPLLFGRYEFVILDPLRRILSPGLQITDLELYNPTSGVFSTFWGPAYIDFGYFMIPFGFAFGCAVSLSRVLVDRGDLFALPLYVLFLLQILLIPIANGLQMSGAIALNLGFFAIWIFSRIPGSRRIT